MMWGYLIFEPKFDFHYFMFVFFNLSLSYSLSFQVKKKFFENKKHVPFVKSLLGT